jgi:hypothetical protein
MWSAAVTKLENTSILIAGCFFDVLQAVEAFQAVRAANTQDSVNRHYRLYVSACSAAIRAQNYEAANE